MAAFSVYFILLEIDQIKALMLITIFEFFINYCIFLCGKFAAHAHLSFLNRCIQSFFLN